MTGTLIAQIISYLLSPIISRLYTSNDMADLGFYSRIVALIAAIATARFELAISLPKRDEHAFLLFKLTLKIIIYSSVLSFLILIIFSYFDNQFENVWIYIFSTVSSFFVAYISLGSNWALRNEKFKSISFQRITNSLSSNFLKVFFGYLHLGSFGIILATTLGYIFSSVKFIKDYFYSKTLFYSSIKKTKSLVITYSQFPKVSLPHVIVDMVRDLIIAFYIADIFGKSIFGYYVYSTMMLSIPISVIGQSFGQVFYQRVSKLFSESKDIFNPLFKTFVLLFFIAIIPFSILYFWGGDIFSIVFGKQWKIAGQYSEILSIWMFFNFILSPISNILIVLRMQKQNFYLGLVSTIGQIICFIIFPFFNTYYKTNFIKVLWVLSLSQAFICIVGIMFIFRSSYRLRK